MYVIGTKIKKRNMVDLSIERYREFRVSELQVIDEIKLRIDSILEDNQIGLGDVQQEKYEETPNMLNTVEILQLENRYGDDIYFKWVDTVNLTELFRKYIRERNHQSVLYRLNDIVIENEYHSDGGFFRIDYYYLKSNRNKEDNRHYTVKQYCHDTFKRNFPNKPLIKLGKLASKYCRENNIEIGKKTDYFGEVNTYPKYVIEYIIDCLRNEHNKDK